MNSLAFALAGLTLGGEPLPPAGPAAATIDQPSRAQTMLGLPTPCARLSVHPFERLPRICPLEPLLCSEPGGLSVAACSPWVQEFHQAAHFPLPRFAADGCPILTDGLLVYEGMRLTVYPDDGTYDLTFTATVPDMPVTVRLQLVFSDADPMQPTVRMPQCYRITLPPIRLEPKANARPGDPTPNTLQVLHRGYSTLFLTRQINSKWFVQRIGTARFGTPIAIDDLNR